MWSWIYARWITIEQQQGANGTWFGWSGNEVTGYRNAIGQQDLNVHGAPNLGVKCEFTPPAGITLGDISATPSVSGDSVFFPDWNGNVFRVLRSNCSMVWNISLTSVVDQYRAANGINTSVIYPLYPNMYKVSRTSPVIVGNTVIVATQQDALIVAFDVTTGQQLWATKAHPHIYAVISQTPSVYQGKIYVGVSSEEELVADSYNTSYPCCTFNGAFVKLDLQTGAIQGSLNMITDPSLVGVGNYSGVAISGGQPLVSPKNGVIYVSTGNPYTVPSTVQ